MVRYILILYVLLSGFRGTLHGQEAIVQPIPVIFDTDMGPDYDDAGALAMLHALADSGETEILATIASNKYLYTVPCIDIINTYFEKPYIPTGEPKQNGVNYTDNENPRWTDSLAVKYPHRIKSNNEAPDALTIYRSVLAAQPDTSVTVITVGPLTNIANLLQSEPDKHSGSDGIELMKKKVKHLVCMAGIFPEGKECNMYADSTASVTVTEQCPVPIIFCGFEAGYPVLTGKRLIHTGINNNPVKDAYSIRMKHGDFEGRYSWDQTTVLAGIRGIKPYFILKKGRIHVAPDGSNTWKDDPDGPHGYLQLRMPAGQIADIIEELMMHLPQKQE